MKVWTIRQLMFAHEVCFPANFIELWTKYSGDQNEATYLVLDMKRQGGLIYWIFKSNSRDSLDKYRTGEIIDLMLTELIGDYA